MKAFYVLTVLLLFSLNLTTCSKSNFIRDYFQKTPQIQIIMEIQLFLLIQEKVVVDYQQEVFVQ